MVCKVTILLIALLLVYMRFEAGFVKVERVKFTLHTKGLKIIQLSDIHMKFLKVSQQKVKNIISYEKPDIIILTGDYIDNPNQINDFLEFLHNIRGSIPVYLCLGNHDHKTFNTILNSSSINNEKEKDYNYINSINDFIALLENNGFTVLHNKGVCIKKNSKKYNLFGLDDLNAGNPSIAKALSFCDDEAKVNIAISHNPDIIYKIPQGTVDFLFCGHFHGGQIWMPFNLEYRLLRKEKLCKIGISRGLHKLNGINLYINRGLGNVCFPLRFLSRPEVTVFQMP